MGQKIQKILVAFDNSKNSIRALKNAIYWAKIMEAKIILVHVISYHGAVAKIVGPYKGTLIEHVKKFMMDAKKQGSKYDVIVDEKILYGNPAEELLKFIKKKNFDLIIVGRRRTSKITGPSLGSVSNALVQNSSIPIMVIS